mgnify:CR=1 FL=1
MNSSDRIERKILLKADPAQVSVSYTHLTLPTKA